jgi:hypothetical protein
LCLGVAGGTAGDGTAVSLQPCGVSEDTTWVWDAFDQYGQQAPLINGTTTNFTQPLVLTANSASAEPVTSTLEGSAHGQFWSTENWG